MKIQRYGLSGKISSDNIRSIFPHESDQLGLSCRHLFYLQHVGVSMPQTSPLPIAPSTLSLGISCLIKLAMLFFL